jgi:hypothetical protein
MFDLVSVSDAVRKQMEGKVSLDGARARSTDPPAKEAAPAGLARSVARLVTRRRDRRQRPSVETATR